MATATSEGWQTVTRRKRYPESWKDTTQPQPPSLIRPYVPFASSYAQAVTRPQPPPHHMPNPKRPQPTYTQNRPQTNLILPTNLNPVTTITNTSSRSTPPVSPTNRPNAVTYISPHSPTSLRFPPSPLFQEWRGRCFRCCRTGHTAAACHFPAKCGKCWADGHVGSRCSAPVRPLNANAKPYNPKPIPYNPKPIPPPYNPKPIPPPKLMEPDFETMLTGTYPHVPPELPQTRTPVHTCFLERDEDYYRELERLQRAIVVYTPDPIGIEKVADIIAQSGLVQARDLTFARISGRRFLVHLPEGIQPDILITAIPAEPWERGLTFQRWSPLDFASINIPNFRVIVDILDLPPHLYKEQAVIRATSGMGLYLGTIAQEDPTNLTTWTGVLATDNLERISEILTMSVGGMNWYMPMRVVKVTTGPIYTREDLPTQPPRHAKPVASRPSGDTSSDEDEDVFTCSLRFLHDLCRERDPTTIPPEIKAMLAGTRRPKICLDDLSTFIHLHKDLHPATENHTDTGPHESNTREDGYAASPNGKEMGNHTVAGQGGPRKILQRESSPKSLENRQMGDRTAVLIQSSTLAADTGIVTKTRGDTRDKHRNRGKDVATHMSLEVGPAQMKKTARRVEPKTRYGTLHKRPHGKGVQIPLAQPPMSQRRNHTKEASVRGKAKSYQTELPLGARREVRKPKPIFRQRKSAAQHGPILKPTSIGEEAGSSKATEQSPINLEKSPDGFYQVHVAYENISKLALGCGVTIEEMDETIHEENEYLKQAGLSASDSSDEEDQVGVDPLTDEEMESDSD